VLMSGHALLYKDFGFFAWVKWGAVAEFQIKEALILS
jgi:hypothetical protein